MKGIFFPSAPSLIPVLVHHIIEFGIFVLIPLMPHASRLTPRIQMRDYELNRRDGCVLTVTCQLYRRGSIVVRGRCTDHLNLGNYPVNLYNCNWYSLILIFPKRAVSHRLITLFYCDTKGLAKATRRIFENSPSQITNDERMHTTNDHTIIIG